MIQEYGKEFQPSESHWAFASYTERVTKRQLQQVMLRGPVFRNGQLCDFHGKHLGAGVYELSLKEKP